MRYLLLEICQIIKLPIVQIKTSDKILFPVRDLFVELVVGLRVHVNVAILVEVIIWLVFRSVVRPEDKIRNSSGTLMFDANQISIFIGCVITFLFHATYDQFFCEVRTYMHNCVRQNYMVHITCYNHRGFLCLESCHPSQC